MEKAMAPHSSTLAWKIPWMEEPGGLPSMGSHRVGWLKQLSSSSSREQQGFADYMSLCSMTLVWEKAVGINECGSNQTALCCFFIPSPLVWISSHEDNKTFYFSFLLILFLFVCLIVTSPPMIDENAGSRVKLPNPEAWSPFICDLGLIIHCF